MHFFAKLRFVASVDTCRFDVARRYAEQETLSQARDYSSLYSGGSNSITPFSVPIQNGFIKYELSLTM